MLTNGEWGGILTKLSARAAAGTQRAEKNQDFPKKVLDKASSMWYPKQVVCKDGERQTVSKNVKNVEKTS